MIDPFFSRSRLLSARADTDVQPGSHAAGKGSHPTPESVAFEIGVILAVTLAIAYAAPLSVRLCGLQ